MGNSSSDILISMHACLPTDLSLIVTERFDMHAR